MDTRARIRYAAVGDSFTEGVGDELPDGRVRGWADLVAQGLADTLGEPIQYANLAIRGRLLRPIIEEQLVPALKLEPTLLSFNGGGNDMLRPRTDIPWVIEQTREAMETVLAAGTRPLLLAGANPTAGIPRGGRVRARGDALTAAAARLARDLGITFSDNWNDPELPARQYWSVDRLHLGPVGHRRVASNVLAALGERAPTDWVTLADAVPAASRREELRYLREHVLPWVGRRLRGRSSGDGRSPKHPRWIWVHPRLTPDAG